MSGMSAAAVAYVVFLVLLVGVCVGSFVNCTAWRMSRGESVLRGRSHCAVCGHPLSARDLIPVVSYAALKGRCRYCGERISPRYPIVELAMACVLLSLFWRYGISLMLLQMAVLSAVLLCLTLTDLDEQRIPNILIVVGIFNCLLFTVLIGLASGLGGLAILIALGLSVADGLIIAVPVLVISLIMDKVLGRQSMGGGDIKLFFMVGMYFVWQENILLVFLACVLGIIFALVVQRRESAGRRDAATFAFGPAIAMAAWLVMLFGDVAIVWYTGLF